MIKKMIKKIFNKLNGSDIETLVKDGLIVGKNFNMLKGSIIDPSHCWLITIGNNVTFAPNVHILAHDASTKFHLDYTKIAKVNIGDNVFIGTGSIVLPGINIGDNSIIGAGSVVVKDIPNNSVYSGNPAKYICTLEEYLVKQSSKMKDSNKFDKSFTVRGGITEEKKSKMKKILEENLLGFVK